MHVLIKHKFSTMNKKTTTLKESKILQLRWTCISTCNRHSSVQRSMFHPIYTYESSFWFFLFLFFGLTMVEVSQSCSTIKMYQHTADSVKFRHNCYSLIVVRLLKAWISYFRFTDFSILQSRQDRPIFPGLVFRYTTVYVSIYVPKDTNIKTN